MGNGESCIRYFSDAVIKCQNPSERRKGFTLACSSGRDRVHQGGQGMVEEPGSWLLIFSSMYRKQREQEVGLRYRTSEPVHQGSTS